LSVYALKPRFQAWLRPLAGALYRSRITANQVTVFACAVSVALGALLAWMPERRMLFLLVPLWFFARMALNALDGMLAREFGQASALGAYLNELCDVVADSALYLPFALLAGAHAGWIGAVIVLAVLAEMAGVLGPMIGASRRYDGPRGKSDRAVVFAILGLLAGLGVELAPALGWIGAALTLLLAATIANRVRRGLAEAGPGRPQ
jgi:CDP-diacylglycerol--glycerol-3-phosphate 3-phosphatidyltransferase